MSHPDESRAAKLYPLPMDPCADDTDVAYQEPRFDHELNSTTIEAFVGKADFE